MAFVPLATVTTLRTFRAVVRRRSGVNDPQAYPIPITDLIVNDLIHDAIMRVRHAANKLIDNEYKTETSVAATSESGTTSLFNISTLGIYDVNRVTVTHPTAQIDILSSGQFDTQLKLRRAVSMKNAVFGKIEAAASNTALDIVIFKGSNVAALSNILVHYPRNPVKQTTDTGMVDLPERLVPIAISVAVVLVRGLAEKQPEKTTDDLVQKALQSEFAQYGLNITPIKN